MTSTNISSRSFANPLKGSRVASRLWIALLLGSCSTLPEAKVARFRFPKDAHVGDVKRPYRTLGQVRSRADYNTLNPNQEEQSLCRNYYNKAVTDMVRIARKAGASAVIDVKTVVFLEDGRVETHATPECSDDGSEGQVLVQGIAVVWKDQDTVPTPGASAAPAAQAEPAPTSARRAFTEEPSEALSEERTEEGADSNSENPSRSPFRSPLETNR